RQSFPRLGWVEHDPEEIWESQLAVAREALAQLPPGGEREVRALGLTNQRETTLVWERATGRPRAPPLVLQDRRAAAPSRGGQGRPVRGDEGPGAGTARPGADRARPRSLLFGDQARLALGPGPRRPGAGGGRGARLRHGRQLAPLAVDRRRPPRDRPLERLPH